jgi:hypothetical protein
MSRLCALAVARSVIGLWIEQAFALTSALSRCARPREAVARSGRAQRDRVLVSAKQALSIMSVEILYRYHT